MHELFVKTRMTAANFFFKTSNSTDLKVYSIFYANALTNTEKRQKTRLNFISSQTYNEITLNRRVEENKIMKY